MGDVASRQAVDWRQGQRRRAWELRETRRALHAGCLRLRRKPHLLRGCLAHAGLV